MPHTDPEPLRSWLRRGFLAVVRGLGLSIVTLPVNTTLFVLSALSIVFTLIGVGVILVPVVADAVRIVSDLNRRLLGSWTGAEIASPYRQPPPMGKLDLWRRYRWAITDPATWRDLAWLLSAVPVSAVLLFAPAVLAGYGVEGMLGVPLLLYSLDVWYGYGLFWPLGSVAEALLAGPQGALMLLAGLAATPYGLRFYARFSRSLLAPTQATALARRVQRLTESRSDTVDAQATELRRIERDLHDGAQARLVAVSMSIGLAEELMSRDPQAAQRLMAEARENSGKALDELRDLVRGIHPPVLVERGLAGAVQALAMTIALPVHTDIDLPGRLPAAVESAAYFAVAELLANVTKHSHATAAHVRLSYAHGRLMMAVRDDGTGGADPAAGTGLRGVQRRLSAFDGTMSVASPPAGPTTVTMELPCELSSPRISPSSGTG